MLIVQPSTGTAETHIIDVCSYITTWAPARGICYDTWMKFCPMIKSADARARCFAELKAAKAGRRPEAAPGKANVATPAGNGGASRSKPAWATSLNTETGVTTTSVRNADGSHTVTVRNAEGKIIDTHVVPSRMQTSMSSTDLKTGITTKSVLNKDGSRTVTRTDAKGNLLSSRVVPTKSPDEASATDRAGVTTHSVRNPDGSRTVTKTDARGNVILKRTYPPSEGQKATRPKSSVMHLKKAPPGAPLLTDFCALVPNPIAKKNCYNKTKMTKKLCELIRRGNSGPGDTKGANFCEGLVAKMPVYVGPFE